MAMKRVIAIDIDEVLAKFLLKISEYHNLHYGTNLTEDHFHSYEFYNVWGGTVEDCSTKVRSFFDSEFIHELPSVPGAYRALKKLSRDFSLHIVTARQNAAEELTKQWLDRNFPNIFDELHMCNHYAAEGVSRSKAEVCQLINASLLVDDSLKYAKDCAKHGIPTILFGDYPWNRPQDSDYSTAVMRYNAITDPNWVICEAFDWNQVVELIYQRLEVPRVTQHVIAAVQLCSTNDKQRNLKAIERLVEKAVQEGKAELVSLPECACFMGESPSQTLQAAEVITDADSEAIAFLRALAKRLHVIIAFCIHEKIVENAEKIYNAQVVIDNDGSLLTPVYRKIHLFDNPLTGLYESNTTVAGNEIVVIDTAIGRLGLSTCYDLRFPELYVQLCKLGHSAEAEIILVPSAFTMITGKAHWEVLLRARAIENEVFVVAAAQSGRHNEKRESYGHSLIVDPWGTIVNESAVVGEDIVYATFDSKAITDIRSKIPVWNHRKANYCPPV